MPDPKVQLDTLYYLVFPYNLTLRHVLLRNGLKRAHVFGITWGISQSVLFFAYAANYSFGAYLIGQGEMEFFNVFR